MKTLFNLAHPLALALLASVSLHAAAESCPARTIAIVDPFPPGGPAGHGAHLVKAVRSPGKALCDVKDDQAFHHQLAATGINPLKRSAEKFRKNVEAESAQRTCTVNKSSLRWSEDGSGSSAIPPSRITI